MVTRELANMSSHNRTKTQCREHGHVGSRAQLAEHSGTKVEPLCLEQGARRTNDTNANGDCPLRRTSGHHGDIPKARGGHLPQTLSTTPKATERSEGGSK